MASAAVLLLCTLVYAVVAALGDAPWGVVPALLVATAVYGVLAGSAASTDPRRPAPFVPR